MFAFRLRLNGGLPVPYWYMSPLTLRPPRSPARCEGYPEVCPSVTCKQPLNPATTATFALIQGLISEVRLALRESEQRVHRTKQDPRDARVGVLPDLTS